MKKTTSRNGFTLIELIIVMVILGIMAAVAVPRYLDSIANAEQSAEDAVISAIEGGLKQYASNSLFNEGRAIFPINPFDALTELPPGYTTDNSVANKDGEWTFVNWYTEENDGNRLRTGKITHQRADNSRWQWDYNAGRRLGDNAEMGNLGDREPFTPQ